MQPDLSYCVVNNDGRQYLLECLTAISRFSPPGLETEVLVLDNASTDGSVEAVRQSHPDVTLIELDRKAGKAENDSTLMKRAKGRYCLLLNEDSELRSGSVSALYEAMEANPEAGAAGAQLLDSDGRPYACAWRFPGVRTALMGALFLHKRYTVQSGGNETVEVDWAQSSVLMVRRAAAEKISWMDPEFFIYYDECDFCKRLNEAGYSTLYVPSALAVHHNQLSTDLTSGLPRITEFHRNRDLYMRKHGNPVSAFAVRILTAWTYGLRTFAAAFMPSAPTGIYWAHTRQALFPYRGESIRDRAEAGSD